MKRRLNNGNRIYRTICYYCTYARMAGVFLNCAKQVTKNIIEDTESAMDAIQPVTDLKKDIDTQIIEVKNELKMKRRLNNENRIFRTNCYFCNYFGCIWW